jgi:2-alkyl-3-oxoalkanoate reductase
VRVLLTGATSLLGAGVVRALHERGDELIVLQRHPSPVAADLALTEHLADLNDRAALSRAMLGVQAVVHLAARVGVVGNAEQFTRTNVAGTHSVLDAARGAGVERLVFISSPSVAHAGAPLVGAPAQSADPDRARGHYSRTKAAAELEVLAADSARLATMAIRPHLVWGPGDTQLVGRIVERARTGRLALVGGGRALIDTTYIDNAVAAIVAGVDHALEAHGRAFVISNGEPRTVAEVLGRVCAAAGVPGPRRSIPAPMAWVAGAVAESAWAAGNRPGDPPMTRFLARQLSTAHWFDLRTSKDVLGWSPLVSLEDGFQRLGAWYAGQLTAAGRNPGG